VPDRPSTPATRPQALFEMQMSELDAREAFIDEQLELVTGGARRLEDAISRTPANAITLQALERDYENISARYNAATSGWRPRPWASGSS
jgi:hypothetical protein